MIAKRYPGHPGPGRPRSTPTGCDRAPRPDRPGHEARCVPRYATPPCASTSSRRDGWASGGRPSRWTGPSLPLTTPSCMLLELMRSRKQAALRPRSGGRRLFRRRSERLDIYRLQDYAEAIPARRGTPSSAPWRRYSDGPERDEGALEREEGYSCLNATARVCQDVILSKSAASGMRDRVTVKGGVLMCALSQRRCATQGHRPRLRAVPDDRRLHSLLCVRPSNLGDGVTVRIAGEIEELSQQDYKGRRVNLKVSDGRSTPDTKLDLGVHASAAMEQDELGVPDVAHRQEGVCLCLRTRKSRCSPRSSSPCCATASERPRKLVSWSVSMKIPPI